MSRSLPRLACLFAVLLMSGALIVPGAQSADASNGRSRYHMNLYRRGVFVTQYTWTWCVGASTQMMLNIIHGTSNSTARKQRRMMNYAMHHDGFIGSSIGGSDAAGFAAALNHYHGGGTYHVVMSTNFRQAVRRAAKSMRVTGKPVGLLVMGGRHAWVLAGFDATADPITTHNWEVTNVYVLGPLYPKEQKGFFDLTPGTRLTFDEFRKPFRIFDDPDSPQYAKHWVTVNP